MHVRGRERVVALGYDEHRLSVVVRNNAGAHAADGLERGVPLTGITLLETEHVAGD